MYKHLFNPKFTLSVDPKRTNLHQLIISKFIEQLIELKAVRLSDIPLLKEICEIRAIRKGDFYFTDHNQKNDVGFIIKGAIKLYCKHSYGEQVIKLYTEGFIGSIHSFVTDNSTNIYKAICVEDSVIVVITPGKLSEFVKNSMPFSAYFNELKDNILLFLGDRIASLQIKAALQRYHDLLADTPQLISRFSLADIANFLGMQPETLCRLRSSDRRKIIKSKLLIA